jgi:hypothetical protein
LTLSRASGSLSRWYVCAPLIVTFFALPVITRKIASLRQIGYFGTMVTGTFVTQDERHGSVVRRHQDRIARYLAVAVGRAVRPVMHLSVIVLVVLLFGSSQARADFVAQCGCADVLNYAVLYTGGGGKTLNITNDTVSGNIGIGGTGQFHADSSQSVINGRLDFAAANTGQDLMNGAVGPAPITYGVTQVQTDLDQLGVLSTTLGAEAATNVAVSVAKGSTQTINAASGTLDASGNYVFNVTSFDMVNGATLVINGDANSYVVLNMNMPGSTVHFNGEIDLSGGIIFDHVLFNILGGANLTGGDTLAAAANKETLHGIFLDMNGNFSLSNTNFVGRLFGGDSQNFQLVSGTNVFAVPEPSSLIILISAIFGMPIIVRLRRKFSLLDKPGEFRG